MNKHNKFMIVLQCVFAGLCIIFMTTHMVDKLFVKRASNFPHSYFALSNWKMTIDDGEVMNVTLPVNYNVQPEQTVKIQTTLPMNIKDNFYLSFNDYKKVSVYIGDELRFSYSPDNKQIGGATVKGIWHFIPLYAKDSGKEVTIVRDGEEINKGFFKTLYYGDSTGVVYGYARESVGYYFFTVLLVIASIFIIIVGGVLHGLFKHKIIIIELAVGILMASLWLVFDSDLFQLVFDNYYIDGVLSYMALLLIPYPILRYVNDMQNQRHEKVFYQMLLSSLVAASVLFVLQLIGILSFEFAKPLIVALHGILTAITLITMFSDIRDGHFKEYRMIAWGMMGFAICFISDVLLYFFAGSEDIGPMLLIGFYFLIVTGFIQQIIEIDNTDRARRQALEANAQKSTFIANISHEIRTPINSIIGMNEMVLRENTDPKIRDYSMQIASSGKLLLGLVNDVLDFSKIEAGKLDIIATPFDVAGFINDIEVLMKERAGAKNLETELIVSEELPSEIIGDDMHIKQVLINLISNAVKYTNSGKVTFIAEATPSVLHDNIYDVNFIVEDTGIGIPKDSIEKLFDSFTRVDEKRNRSIEGTGLGLSIVKRLIDEMGGTIKVDSEYGIGSKFAVTIPLEVSDTTPIGNLNDAIDRNNSINSTYVERFHAPRARVLVVDDNAVNLKVVSELLKSTQVQIETASGGKECVYMCRNKRYDLILMDHRMPDPDGIETLHLLKDDFDGLNNDTNVIVLTANAFSGLKEKYIAEGFVDYLSKPIDSKLLEDRVMKFLPKELVITDFAETEHEISGSVKNDNSVSVNNTTTKEKEKMSFGDSMRTVKGMDYDATLEQYGSEEFLVTLFETIIEDGREKIQYMYKYLENKDYKNFGIEAHAAKSTMATIYASELSAHAKLHEFAAKEDNIEFIEKDAKVFLAEYTDMLDRIEAAMKACE